MQGLVVCCWAACGMFGVAGTSNDERKIVCYPAQTSASTHCGGPYAPPLDESASEDDGAEEGGGALRCDTVVQTAVRVAPGTRAEMYAPPLDESASEDDGGGGPLCLSGRVVVLYCAPEQSSCKVSYDSAEEGIECERPLPPAAQQIVPAARPLVLPPPPPAVLALLPPPPEAPARGRGKYSRAPDPDTGARKGIRLPWLTYIRENLSDIQPPYAWYTRHREGCSIDCAFGQKCIRRITLQDLELCAECSFGFTDPSLSDKQALAQMLSNHSASDKWFNMVFDLREVHSVEAGVQSIAYKVAAGCGLSVCQGAMRCAYFVPPSTWDAICDAVMKNEVHWRDRGEKRARQHAQNKETKVFIIENWFVDRFEMFDTTATSSGHLLHDACVWADVIRTEFLPEQINCLGNGHFFGNTLDEALQQNKLRTLHPSIQEGKTRALMTFAKMKNPAATKAFRLVSRSQHKGVPDCGECADIREERRTIQRRHGTKAELARNTERAKKHAVFYMGERRALAAMKLSASREGQLP